MEDSALKYDLFRKAYKKLKSTAYYDKTNLHLRDRIAEAENTLNITIEERLKDLHQAFVASDSTKWERKKEDILESISCRLLPIVCFRKRLWIQRKKKIVRTEQKAF